MTPAQKVEFHATTGLRLAHALRLLLQHLAERTDFEASAGDLKAAEALADAVHNELCAIDELGDSLALGKFPEVCNVS